VRNRGCGVWSLDERAGCCADPTMTILYVRSASLSSGATGPWKSTAPRSYWIRFVLPSTSGNVPIVWSRHGSAGARGIPSKSSLSELGALSIRRRDSQQGGQLLNTPSLDCPKQKGCSCQACGLHARRALVWSDTHKYPSCFDRGTVLSPEGDPVSRLRNDVTRQLHAWEQTLQLHMHSQGMVPAAFAAAGYAKPRRQTRSYNLSWLSILVGSEK
jgi:hypothetical protein